MLEQLQQAEAEKRSNEALEVVIESLKKKLNNSGVHTNEDLTLDNVLKAGTDLIRETTYRDFPLSNPIAVEALLLAYRNFLLEFHEEIDASPESELNQLLENFTKEGVRFGKTIRKTLRMMS